MLQDIPDLILDSCFLDEEQLASSKKALMAARDILVTYWLTCSTMQCSAIQCSAVQSSAGTKLQTVVHVHE